MNFVVNENHLGELVRVNILEFFDQLTKTIKSIK